MSTMPNNTKQPTRPAPAPPPPTACNLSSNVHRYTPTTDWEDEPHQGRKLPPPRPPPPKLHAPPAVFKKSAPQSINILSALFGKSAKGTSIHQQQQQQQQHPLGAAKANATATKQVYRAPRNTQNVQQLLLKSPSSYADTQQTNELIDFSTPPSSPTLTHRTNTSDCLSVDSFSSDTPSNASPQNGNISQAESGFEDDFTSASTSANGWPLQRMNAAAHMTLADPFTAPPIRNEPAMDAKIRRPVTILPPPISQKPRFVDQSAFYSNNTISFQAHASILDDDHPLNNGKSLISTAFAPTMPTIIKPAIFAKPMVVPKKVVLQKRESSEEAEDQTPSPPMPRCEPPPPPPEYFDANAAPCSVTSGEEAQSYGIALYDYESEHEGDLNFRANEKIYLIRQENEEWMFGRSKRGCEGMFPVNYIDIKVPLMNANDEPKLSHRTPSLSSSATSGQEGNRGGRLCRVLYDFQAEADGDLTIKENDLVTIIRNVNEEWLYGRKGTEQGQFPANFVEYL